MARHHSFICLTNTSTCWVLYHSCMHAILHSFSIYEATNVCSTAHACIPSFTYHLLSPSYVPHHLCEHAYFHSTLSICCVPRHSCMHALLHSLNRHLLSTYYFPGTVLGVGSLQYTKKTKSQPSGQESGRNRQKSINIYDMLSGGKC